MWSPLFDSLGCRRQSIQKVTKKSYFGFTETDKKYIGYRSDPYCLQKKQKELAEAKKDIEAMKNEQKKRDMARADNILAIQVDKWIRDGIFGQQVGLECSTKWATGSDLHLTCSAKALLANGSVSNTPIFKSKSAVIDRFSSEAGAQIDALFNSITKSLFDDIMPACQGLQNGQACCPLSCGQCGGPGCSGRGAGADSCCWGHITTAKKSCSTHSAPCFLDA